MPKVNEEDPKSYEELGETKVMIKMHETLHEISTLLMELTGEPDEEEKPPSLIRAIAENQKSYTMLNILVDKTNKVREQNDIVKKLYKKDAIIFDLMNTLHTRNQKEFEPSQLKKKKSEKGEVETREDIIKEKATTAYITKTLILYGEQLESNMRVAVDTVKKIEQYIQVKNQKKRNRGEIDEQRHYTKMTHALHTENNQNDEMDDTSFILKLLKRNLGPNLHGILDSERMIQRMKARDKYLAGVLLQYGLFQNEQVNSKLSNYGFIDILYSQAKNLIPAMLRNVMVDAKKNNQCTHYTIYNPDFYFNFGVAAAAGITGYMARDMYLNKDMKHQKGTLANSFLMATMRVFSTFAIGVAGGMLLSKMQPNNNKIFNNQYSKTYWKTRHMFIGIAGLMTYLLEISLHLRGFYIEEESELKDTSYHKSWFEDSLLIAKIVIDTLIFLITTASLLYHLTGRATLYGKKKLLEIDHLLTEIEKVNLTNTALADNEQCGEKEVELMRNIGGEDGVNKAGVELFKDNEKK